MPFKQAVFLFALCGFVPGAEALDKNKIIQKVENYINEITTLSGSFTQDGPQRQQNRLHFSQGNFWISRPGKMRFAYTQPTRALILADGIWIAVQNTPTALVERYPLKATPARFILEAGLSIKKNARVEGIEIKNNRLSLWLSAKENNLGGKIKLYFQIKPFFALQGWTIEDAQGLTTQIRLKNVQRNLPLDPKLFFIQDKKVFPSRSRR